MVKNEKSLKKDGRKKLSCSARSNHPQKEFFLPSFFNDFSFFNHLFQAFSPPSGWNWVESQVKPTLNVPKIWSLIIN